MGEATSLACLTCDAEWEGSSPCPLCQGPGVPGTLRDFCPHGSRKPFRGWPCPRCRANFLELHQGVDIDGSSWAYSPRADRVEEMGPGLDTRYLGASS